MVKLVLSNLFEPRDTELDLEGGEGVSWQCTGRRNMGWRFYIEPVVFRR
jgi:hypothetical protein